MKIVLNGCYGGFGLSYYAQALYLMAQDKIPYFYQDISTYTSDYKRDHCYKRLNVNEVNQLNGQSYIYCTATHQAPTIFEFPKDIINFSDIDRADPLLVSIVETIGSDAASGRFAQLYIEEIPDGTLYQIDNYDGMESLVTQDDDDWIVAKNNSATQETFQKISNIWQCIKPTEEPDQDLAFKM